MADRLLQEETQTHDSKGPRPGKFEGVDPLLMAFYIRHGIALPSDLPTDAQVRDQDSLFGVLDEEKKS